MHAGTHNGIDYVMKYRSFTGKNETKTSQWWLYPFNPKSGNFEPLIGANTTDFEEAKKIFEKELES